MKNVVVIGGGPAGMMAAGTAAQNGNKVTIVEKMKDLERNYSLQVKADVM